MIIDNQLDSNTLATLRSQVIEKMDHFEVVDDTSVYQLIENIVYQKMIFESIEIKEATIIHLFNGLRKLGVIQPLLDDDTITEIMVNEYDEIYIEQNGKIIRSETVFDSKEELELFIQKIVGKMDRKVNEKHPICDVRLECGARVNIVLGSVAIEGPCMTIRKFPVKKMVKDDIVSNGTISKEGMEFLELLVRKKYNIFISGGTSSGKTTLLNVLSDAIGDQERVITIEDSAELRLKSIHNLIRLEARRSKGNQGSEVPIRDLIKSSLRMRPDRIIIGEIRGDEAIDMMMCMNTGHDGSISTGHGNSSYDMLFRMETMVMTGSSIPLIAIRQQIVSALDIMIHIQKIRERGRRVTEISEVVGLSGESVVLTPLFQYDEKNDILVKSSNEMMHLDKMQWN